MDLLRDPIWQFIGAVLAVLGIAATFYIASRQKGRKELSAGFLIKKHLIQISDEVSDRISVSFNGKPVQNLKIYSYGVKNSGSLEIRTEDFERPLQLELSDGVRMLEVRSDRQHPKELSPRIAVNGQTVEVTPLLLNPGDFFVIDILATGEPGNIKVNQRIAGINKIHKINTGIRFQKHHLQNSFTNSILATIVGVGMYFIARASGEASPMLAFLSVGGVIVMLFILTAGEWLIGRITNNNNRYIDNT